MEECAMCSNHAANCSTLSDRDTRVMVLIINITLADAQATLSVPVLGFALGCGLSLLIIAAAYVSLKIRCVQSHMLELELTDLQ